MGITNKNPYIRKFEELTSKDVPIVGGKNASLGEMICLLKEKGVAVPTGFATTSEAYWKFIEANNLTEKINAQLQELESGSTSLDQIGKSIRRLFRDAKFPAEIATAIRDAYHELSQRYNIQ